jgi:EAL domain-containing protein (putative c-di-GMP-specific phosphodiesterase class I)/GGDEF domain-containing protein
MENKLQEESVDQEMKDAAGLLKSILKTFSESYLLDIKNNKYIQLHCVADSIFSCIFGEKGKINQSLADFCREAVAERDSLEMCRFFDMVTLPDRLKESRVLTAVFHDPTDELRKAKFIRVSYDEFGRAEKAILVIVEQPDKYSYMDRITGGNNYSGFKNALENSEVPGYFISMNVHNFKVVNSVCGIKRGNVALREIWRCIAAVLREHDVACHSVADNFNIFIATDDREDMIDRLKKLQESLLDLSMKLDIPRVDPYFGIASFMPGDEVDSVHSHSIMAVNQIRNNEDRLYAFFSQQDEQKIVEEVRMTREFPNAIRKEYFEVWYQPKYSPATGEINGAEALVRWRKPDGSMISPGVFIPIFERNGLIRLLDEYVYTKVCHRQKAWFEKWGKVVPISINLSRASLYYANVVPRYVEILNEMGLSPKLVPLEITESADINNASIKELIAEFKKADFSLHLDDFGSGYSSLATLNTLQFDTIKLDKSLVDYIGNYSGDCLLRHTIGLAHELGMHIVAEGVEVKEQVEFLKGLECDSIQGYYYSRPLPEKEFIELCYKNEQA